ncbi:RNA-guided endonuclease InsQ/TnpB family protein [Lentzea terrae]|uniref:RNA-guided endonuclease InsQ/TnpB family protein n=1 Tax=Lentzea terrae TaxID=2200761 RepID=UPI000DD375A5|nr:RNA-guided endonuclease TnpB family protein [Lentzea terrae]
MRTAYRCRAYPTPEQAEVLNRTFGCVRLVWNKTLSERNHRYRIAGARTSYRKTDAALTEWKRSEELAFLSEVSCVPLQQTLRHQHAAFQNFLSGRSHYRRFKSRTGRQSAHYTRSAFRMRNGTVTLAKTDAPLRFTWSFGDIAAATLDPTMVIVSREPDGRWYVTFAVDVDTPAPVAPARHAVGVDLGLTDFLVTSDEVRVANPRHLTRKARNLARYQRRLARCRPGSNNRRKAKVKVAGAHRKARNARQDFLHRTSATLVRAADVIVIDRWYPSSKTCSTCGHLLAELQLSTRHWTCPGCRTRHDRDLNAAKNILAAGRAVARGDSGDACGADVRRQGPSLPQSAVKQEIRAARSSA